MPLVSAHCLQVIMMLIMQHIIVQEMRLSFGVQLQNHQIMHGYEVLAKIVVRFREIHTVFIHTAIPVIPLTDTGSFTIPSAASAINQFRIKNAELRMWAWPWGCALCVMKNVECRAAAM